MRTIRRFGPSRSFGVLAVWLLGCSGAAGLHAQTLVPLRGIAEVAAGGGHTCALTRGGGVKCWGDNGAGALGDGTTTDRYSAVDVSGLTRGVAAVSAGGSYTCALTTGGGVRCWGLDYYGQLGDGGGAWGVVRPSPVDVAGLTQGVAAISTGEDHTCALTAAGGVKCWGHNSDGQLGDGTTTNRLVPVDVAGLAHGVAAVSAGGRHTCARMAAGGAKCWGHNSDGRLGDGTTTDRLTPVDVQGLDAGIAAIGAGEYHTCARTADARVQCWGNNGWYALGDAGFGGDYSTSPRTVTGLSGVIALSTNRGYGHACALTAGGRVMCWGEFYFEVGGVFPVFSIGPVDQGFSGAVRVGTGWASLQSHVCAVTAQGGVQCLGGNRGGQLGNGSAGDAYVDSPQDVLIADAIFADGFD